MSLFHYQHIRCMTYFHLKLYFLLENFKHHKIKDFTLIPLKVTSLLIAIFRKCVLFYSRITVHGPPEEPLGHYIEKLSNKMSKRNKNVRSVYLFLDFSWSEVQYLVSG